MKAINKGNKNPKDQTRDGKTEKKSRQKGYYEERAIRTTDYRIGGHDVPCGKDFALQ